MPGWSLIGPDSLNPKEELLRLPSKLETIKADACTAFDELVQEGRVNADNYPEIAEQVVTVIVDKHGLVFDSDDEEVKTWNSIYFNLMTHAGRNYPNT